MWENSFEELMEQTMIVEPWENQDGHGDGYFGNPIECRCRVVQVTKLLRLSATREVVSTAKVYLAGSPGIDEKDRVTLPDGTQPPILSVRRFPDEDGDHHEVVFV